MNKEIMRELDFISTDIERYLRAYSVLLTHISELAIDVYEVDEINVDNLSLAYIEYKSTLNEIKSYTEILTDYLDKLKEKQNEIDNVVYYLQTHIA